MGRALLTAAVALGATVATADSGGAQPEPSPEGAYGWGLNDRGQLGDDTYVDSTTPVQVVDLTEVTHVAAGDEHSVALMADGTAWAWGINSLGQLGSVEPTGRPWPTQVANLTDITQVAAGDDHNLAITADGTAWGWGYNGSGELGNDDDPDLYEPVRVPGLTDVTHVAAGTNHSLAVVADGTVWAWGSNMYGQLGNDNIIDFNPTPMEVSGLTGITHVAAGRRHSLALAADGTVWAWGANGAGQLGDGTTTDTATPVQVTGLTDVIQVSAGAGHSLALTGDGTAWAWGSNGLGQLGDGTTTSSTVPVQVTGLTDVTDISAGYWYSLAASEDGTARAWGGNRAGQLGNGTTTSSTVPVPAGELTDVVDVEAGRRHSLAAVRHLNEAPDCSAAVAGVESIEFPGLQFVPVDVLGVTDPEGDTVAITIDGIRQDERTGFLGLPLAAPDGRGVGAATAEVRAERGLFGDGRVYHVAFTADDGNGGTCTGTVTVEVPWLPHHPAGDGGPLYDSTV